MATEHEIDYQDYLGDLIEMAEQDLDTDLFSPAIEAPGPAEVQRFSEAGLMTTNAGLVLTYPNGDVYHLTIVQAKVGQEV